jgi:hypothetical protein
MLHIWAGVSSLLHKNHIIEKAGTNKDGQAKPGLFHARQQAVLQELGGMRVRTEDQAGQDIWSPEYDWKSHDSERIGSAHRQEKSKQSSQQQAGSSKAHPGISVNINIHNSKVRGGIRIGDPVEADVGAHLRSDTSRATTSFSEAMRALHEFVQSLSTSSGSGSKTSQQGSKTSQQAKGAEAASGHTSETNSLVQSDHPTSTSKEQADDWMRRAHGIHVVMSIADYDKLMARMATKARDAARMQAALLPEAQQKPSVNVGGHFVRAASAQVEAPRDVIDHVPSTAGIDTRSKGNLSITNTSPQLHPGGQENSMSAGAKASLLGTLTDKVEKPPADAHTADANTDLSYLDRVLLASERIAAMAAKA